MKTSFALFIALFVFVGSSFAQKGVMKFVTETHDFGKIVQGTPVTHVFTFRNVGTDPIIINDASASCGCTKPSWSKEPVMPGKTGSVSATFNAGVVAPFNKSVTVTSNAESPSVTLYLKGEVVATKEQTAATPADAKKKGK